MPLNRNVLVLAVIGATGLGTLAAATVPTSMTSGATSKPVLPMAAMDDRTFYVEPAPQDLTPDRASLPDWLASTEPGFRSASLTSSDLYPAGYSDDYAVTDQPLSEAFDNAMGPATSSLETVRPNLAPSIAKQASDAEQVAEAVKQAETQ